VFLPADCGRNQTRGARAMDRKATDSIVTAIGIDIGKNIFLSIPKTKPDSI
jgi:hypothetical protein